MAIKQAIKDIRRFEQIIAVLFKYELGYIIAQLSLKKHLSLHNRIQKNKFGKFDTQPEKIRFIFEELGATFVKLGQLLSLRPDLIPLEYCKEFSKLQDAVKPFPSDKVKEIIELELKKPINELFDGFNDSPLASASIGQVHEAVLKSGKRVAVKVQRPNIEEVFLTDIDIMYHLAGLLKKRFSSDLWDPVRIVQEFERFTKNELDYLKEANNIEKIYNALEEKDVVVPNVLWDYTTKRVITMDLIEGVSISETKNLPEEKRKKIINSLLNVLFKQIFIDGAFHADPHAGNVFLMKDQRIALLDLGITGYLTPALRQDISTLFLAIISADIRQIAMSMYNLGFVESSLELRTLEQDIYNGLEEYYNLSIDKIDIGEIFYKLIEISKKDRIKFPVNFVLLGRCLITLEGLIKSIDPNFNLIKNTRPIIKKHTKKKLISKKELVQTTYQYKNLVKTFPFQFNQILKRFKEGSIRVDIEDTDVRRLTEGIDTSSNRLTYGAIIASLVLASSVFYYINKPPYVWDIPLIAFICFIIAIFLGFSLIVSIIRENR